MKSETYPLPMPPELMKEVRQAAKITGLSMADVMRQSVKVGLPKVLEQFPGVDRKQLKPLTKEEARLAYEVPNKEFDALEHHCANLSYSPQREED